VSKQPGTQPGARNSRARATKAEQERNRDAAAARLRARRYSYDDIAAELGYADRSGAWRAVERARKQVLRDADESMVSYDLDELDEMAREAWKVLRNTHFVVDRGEVVFHPETGQPLIDDAPILDAIRRLLDVQQRRAKLVGLDAPSRATVTHASADIDAAAAELAAELARRAGEGAPR
jgi:hypothetical protein